MKTSLKGGFAVAVLVLLAGALAAPKLISLNKTDAEPPDAASAAEPPLAVRVERIEPQRLGERLSTTGTIRANEQVELVSEIAGKVVDIFFSEGSRVREGELLVKIDDTELRASRARALYRVELAERREQRQQQLLEEGVVSQQEYDFVAGELNVLRAELQLIEAQLVKTEIRAPFTGTIGLRWVSAGSYLSPQTRIATLQDLDPVKIDFSVPERYATVVAVGDEVGFRVKSSDRPFTGEIYAIEPYVDPETRSLTLRARSTNPGGLLRPGAFADVELVVGEVEDALVVPAIAVVPELGGKKIFVYQDGTAQPRSVETGIRTETGVQIVRGLEPGERVIVSGIQRLRAGQTVTLDPADSDLGNNDTADTTS